MKLEEFVQRLAYDEVSSVLDDDLDPVHLKRIKELTVKYPEMHHYYGCVILLLADELGYIE